MWPWSPRASCPRRHLVDAGDADAERLAAGQRDYAIDKA
jgi:hypothetical protein